MILDERVIKKNGDRSHITIHTQDLGECTFWTLQTRYRFEKYKHELLHITLKLNGCVVVYKKKRTKRSFFGSKDQRLEECRQR